jgi:TRAP-type C4-dicarboxylate transport system substrate-binding protein
MSVWNLRWSGLWIGMLIASASAVGQEFTLKVHHFLPTHATTHAQLLVPWCEKVAKESSGRLKCQIYPTMQLGGTPPQLYDQVKDGVVDIVWTLPGYTAGRFPIAEAFELPFTMTNAEATSRALWEYVQKHARAEFKDVHPLAFHTHGPGYIHMRETPIRSQADFKGLKIRAPTRLTNKLLAALGATPVGMPVPQVPEALSKGVIDGAVIPWEVVPAVKVQELTKHHTETDPKSPALYTSVFIFAMNLARYRSLPDDLRKVIDANSGAGVSAWAGKVFQQADPPGRKLAEDRRNQFYMISSAELERWSKSAQLVADDWAKEMTSKGHDGKALISSARALIRQHTK